MTAKITFEQFKELMSAQLEVSGVKQIYWKTLHEKLQDEVYDAGDSFIIQKLVLSTDSDKNEDHSDNETSESNEENVEYLWQVVVNSEDGISTEDGKQIYLIDHAWTYRVEQAREQLQEFPTLLARMIDLMDLTDPALDKTAAQCIDLVMLNMWRHNQTYSMSNEPTEAGKAGPVWYVLDEFGSRIQYPEIPKDPSFRVVPIFYPPLGCSFSIMWPLCDLKHGDEVTRNYVEHRDSDMKKLRMFPWLPEDYSQYSYQLPRAQETMQAMYKMKDSLPNEIVTMSKSPRERPMKVFCNVDLYLKNFQQDDTFILTENMAEADILFLGGFNEYKELSEECPQVYISQFPNQHILTVKHLLSLTVRSMVEPEKLFDVETMETFPTWFQTTFDLLTELKQFVSYFQSREKRGLDNHWIIKPYNLQRTAGIEITNNLDHIVRAPDQGPRIISKYIEDPVLYELEGVGRVKFDLRVHVLLKSVRPLSVFMHKLILPRFADKAFSLDMPDDLCAHLSVLTYRKGSEKMKLIDMETFTDNLEKQNPGLCWKNVEADIALCLKECMIAATTNRPPLGVGHSPQSRAFYGVDVMLKWTVNAKGELIVQPVILEFNMVPDFWRHAVCKPDILSDFMHTLYTDETESHCVVEL